MKRLLAGVAFGVLSFASGANATNHVFTLTGDMANFTSSTFTFNGVTYETGVLELSGFDPFTLQDGDTIEADVAITGGPFALPVRDQMFFGFNLDNILTGAQPTDASSSGQFSFDGGAPVGAGCGNCTSLIYGLNNGVVSFTSLLASGAFALGSDYEVNHLTISYQVNNAAVPEPGAWALMILGFGGAGAALRRRRNRDTYVAA